MDLKEQLLAATVQVVTEHGFRAATTRRIAQEAGVNEVTLFRHFGSKDVLLREAMAWASGKAPVPELPGEPGDARAELTTWAELHFRHLLEVRGQIRKTIGEFEADPGVASWSRQVPKRLHRTLEAYVGRLRDLGRTSGDWDLRAATGLLLGALFADAINRDFFPDHLPEPIADAPRRYVELFLAAIGYHDSRAE
ncbi:MAG: TetR/AcrR family transcriptional regulator [Vicinamibacterales bacterium]